MPRCPGGVIGLASVPQQQPVSSMPLLAYANYTMGSPQVGFFSRVEPPTILYIICLVSILVSAFYFQVPSWMPYCPVEAQLLGLASLQPFGFYPWHGHMCNMVMVIGPRLVCIEWLLPPLPWVGGSLQLLLSAVPQPSHLYGGAYSLGGLAECHPIHPPSLHGGEGSSFPGLVPSDDMVDCESVMGVKPCDSSVVIGYQVDEFTCTWSAEWFVAHSYIYPGFMGKVSFLTHFPLEPGCGDYAFWIRLLLTLNKAWIPS